MTIFSAEAYLKKPNNLYWFYEYNQSLIKYNDINKNIAIFYTELEFSNLNKNLTIIWIIGWIITRHRWKRNETDLSVKEALTY